MILGWKRRLREDVTPRLPYDSKSSSGVPVRVNNAGKNTPDLEIMWFPLILGNFGVKTPPGIYGATAVRMTFAAFVIYIPYACGIGSFSFEA